MFNRLASIYRTLVADPQPISSAEAVSRGLPQFGSPMKSWLPTDPTDFRRDQIPAEVWPLPFRGPLDLDDYGCETPEMRRAYREVYRRHPDVQAAIEGKVAAVACLDVSVLPKNKDNPGDQEAAQFVKDAVDVSSRGWEGLIEDVARPAFIDGFSVGDIVLQEDGDRWKLKHVRSVDTTYIRFQLDEFRNITAITSLRRGMQSFDPQKVLIFTHKPLFANPFGQADMRAAYKTALMIEDTYLLWQTTIKVFGAPVAMGKYGRNETKASLETALKMLRAGGYLALPQDSDVEILNMAAAANFAAFERKIDKLRERLFLAVRGAYLPFMQGTGQGGETRGNADTSKHAGSDPREELITKAIARCLTMQLIPHLVLPNFGPAVGLPRIVIGGVDWAETKAQLEVAKIVVNDLHLPISKKHVYEISQFPPPSDPEDELGPPEQPAPFGPPGVGAGQGQGQIGGGGGGLPDMGFRDPSQNGNGHPNGVHPTTGTGPATFAAPGPPPRPGLQWKEESHRWIRPEEPGGGTQPISGPPGRAGDPVPTPRPIQAPAPNQPAGTPRHQAVAAGKNDRQQVAAKQAVAILDRSKIQAGTLDALGVYLGRMNVWQIRQLNKAHQIAQHNMKPQAIHRFKAWAAQKAGLPAPEAPEAPAKKPKKDKAAVAPAVGDAQAPPLSDVKSRLQKSPVKNVKRMGGGCNVSQILTLEDGSKGVFKPAAGEVDDLRKGIEGGTMYRREAAASTVADLIGLDDLVPATTIREHKGKLGSIQHFAEGAVEASKLGWGVNAYDGQQDAARAAAFDYLIGHSDRHKGNWMLQKEKLVLIDNGLAFPKNHDDFYYPNCRMMRHVAVMKFDVPPEVAEWSKNIPAMEAGLRQLGIEEEAIALTTQRLHTLAGHAGKPFGDLPALKGGKKIKDRL